LLECVLCHLMFNVYTVLPFSCFPPFAVQLFSS